VAIYSSAHARRTRTAGPARSTRIVLVVATTLFFGSVGTALAVGTPPTPRPTTLTTSPSPGVATVAGCEPAAASAGSAVPTHTTKQRYALPTGWIWYGDPTGLVVAVPRDWTRTSAGSRTCFRDPAGGRSFGVDTAVRIAGSPTAYFEQAELGELTNGTLPGYESIGAGPLQLRQGGADWEFRWRPAGGALLHERRFLLSMGHNRTYLLNWTTRDPDWSINEPNQQLILASID
jgi:hypothetical protein